MHRFSLKAPTHPKKPIMNPIKPMTISMIAGPDVQLAICEFALPAAVVGRNLADWTSAQIPTPNEMQPTS